MFWLLWPALKAILCFVLLIFTYACFTHISVLIKAKFYTDQGIVKVDGFNTFFIGNGIKVLKFKKLRDERANTDLKPTKGILSWMLDQHDPSGKGYDAAKNPIMAANLGGMLMLLVQDPTVI